MRYWGILPLDDIAAYWPFVEPYLQRACEASGNKYSPADFLKMLEADEAQLWVGRTDRIDAAAITDVIHFPNRKIARVTIGMGENPTDLDTFINIFELWARSIGCDGVQSSMRPGFAPQFSKANWKKTHVLMEKDF